MKGVTVYHVHLWAGHEHLPCGRIDHVDAAARSAVDADEAVEARVAHHPITTGALDAPPDVVVHVHEPHVTASHGFFFLEGAGVNEEQAVAGPVRGGEDGAGDEVAPPFGHAPEPAHGLYRRPREYVEDGMVR